MNKSEVVAEAIDAIPQWLAFLDLKEKEQQKILAEIQAENAPLVDDDEAAALIPFDAAETIINSQPAAANNQQLPATNSPPTPDPRPPAPSVDIDPLDWLEDDAPPPTDDAQQPGLIEAVAPVAADDEEIEVAYVFMQNNDDETDEAAATNLWDEEE